MSSTAAAAGHQQSWLHILMNRKPEHIVADWGHQFRALDADGSIGRGSPVASGKGPTASFTGKLWSVDDPETKKKFYVSRGPKTFEMKDFYSTFTKLGIAAVVNFSRLHEGPLGTGGAADFTDALYFPCTPGEIAHFVIPVGDTSAEVIVTNVRVTMINDVVAVSDLDVDVNVNIKQAVVGGCHTIEPRQNTMIQHIQHFNWPPDEQPWCTDSVLQTLSSLHRLQAATEDPEKTMAVLVLCADGSARSGAFVALNQCLNRASSGGSTKPFDLHETVKGAVESVRAQCPRAMRNEKIFIWLNYAVVEHCVKRLVESAAEKKESKRACEWLAKLRKVVYAGEKKSALNISLMG